MKGGKKNVPCMEKQKKTCLVCGKRCMWKKTWRSKKTGKKNVLFLYTFMTCVCVACMCYECVCMCVSFVRNKRPTVRCSVMQCVESQHWEPSCESLFDTDSSLPLLQCVAVCCSVLQCVQSQYCESSCESLCESICDTHSALPLLHCVAVCCSVLQCVAVCSISALQV